MTTQCIFPADTIRRILYHTDIRDVVRWRRVSKWFHTVACDPTLLKTLYTNAPFPRPPYPLRSQSNASLERALVRSAQLAQSWTTRTMRDLASVRIQLEGGPITPPKLIRGRWLVACEWDRRFVLHDVDAADQTHARQVLWEHENPVVSFWDACSMAPVKGQCIVYVLLEVRASGRRFLSSGSPPDWKLLEFRLNDDSGELYDSVVMDPPPYTSLRYTEFRGGKSPFLFIPASCQGVVFDTRTRVFHTLPVFRFALDETLRQGIRRDDSPMDNQVIFTDTHFICFNYVHNAHLDVLTVIHVLAPPTDGAPVENNKCGFRLTHEGIVESVILAPEVLKSSVDPIAGVINVTLLDYTTRRRELQVTRIDLTLPEPSSAHVLPLTVDMQHFGLPKDGVLMSSYGSWYQHVDVIDDGHVRGFCRGIPRRRIGDPMENDHVVKFTIDTTQDPWAITCGKFGPVEWSHAEDMWFQTLITFDGMRGKLCYADPMNYGIIVVLDIE